MARQVLGMPISPFSTVVEQEGEDERLGVVELRDLARGFCAALFVSLPLLYTEEMWTRSLLLPGWALYGWVALGYVICLGYVSFAGYRGKQGLGSPWLDALSALGIGLAASLITLLLIGRYSVTDAADVIVRMALIEMVPTAIGASVAINQLGGGSGGQSPHVETMHPDLRMLMATTLGATLFAFNIAPTIETQKITYSVGWWHLLAIAVFSLVVSYMTVFVARFSKTSDREGRIIRSRWVETVVAYLVSLAASYTLLVMFGYIQTGVPPQLQLAWIIVLGYGTTLGGAAGRVIL